MVQDSKDILAAIGPSICQDCYEVSEDVIVKFQKSFEEKYWPELFYQKENGKYQVTCGKQMNWYSRKPEF